MSTFSRIARLPAAAAVATSLAACGGGDGGVVPVDPCATAGACEVAGMDLALDAFTLDAVNVPAIQMQAVSVNGPVNVAFTVRSRGSVATAASTLTVCVNPGCTVTRTAGIPALAPGRTHSGSVALPAPAQAGEVSVAGALPGGDAEPGNDARSVPLLVERPDLRMTVSSVDDQRGWPVGGEGRAVVTIRNHAYVAGAPASTARVCMFVRDRCEGGVRTPAFPAIAAGAAHDDTIVFALPFSVLRWPDRRESVPITACVDPDLDQVRDDLDCGSKVMYVLTDLDAMCPPATLSPGGTVSGVLQTSDCDLSFFYDVDLVKIVAAANTPYTLTLAAFPPGRQVNVMTAKLWNLKATDPYSSVLYALGYNWLSAGGCTS